MNGLEMPEAVSGARIQGYQGISEQSRTFAVAAEVIGGGRSQREKDHTALDIDTDRSPRVNAAAPVPRIFGPGIISELPLLRDRVESPEQFTRTRIKGAHIP